MPPPTTCWAPGDPGGGECVALLAEKNQIRFGWAAADSENVDANNRWIRRPGPWPGAEAVTRSREGRARFCGRFRPDSIKKRPGRTQ